MPLILYDKDGNEVENVPSPEDIKEMNEKIEKMEADLKEKSDQLAKFSEKDLNFSALRSANKEEREKILENYNKKEKAFVEKMEAMQDQIDSYQKGIMGSYESEILTRLAGTDEEKRKHIQETAKTFVGEVKTKEDLEVRLKNAAKLIGINDVSPLHSYVPSVGYSESKGTKFTDTEEGKNALRSYFPNVPAFKEKK